MELTHSRREVSKQINLIDFKNISFYKVFGRNRPIQTIDGYDGTVHGGPFWLSSSRRILTEG